MTLNMKSSVNAKSRHKRGNPLLKFCYLPNMKKVGRLWVFPLQSSRD